MNRHITEQQLIEYQFDLADQEQNRQMADHLKDCADCRKALEEVKGRFGALDLLEGQMEVSDELISQVVSVAKKPAKPRLISFRRPAWIAAALAVVVVASVLMLNRPDPISKSQSEIAKNDAAKVQDKRVAMDFKGKSGELYKFHGTLDSDIPEKPPFAPASAIELVTLPRRENVQLTIYNSADLTLVRESRKLTLKKGWNWLQFMWADTLIDPTSLRLEPKAHNDKIEVQQLVYPARLKDIGRWLVRSQIEGQVTFEITYLTSGVSWRAFYMATLSPNERQMDINGYVRVSNNSGEDYEDAQTRLIVGKVHQLDRIAELANRQYPTAARSKLQGAGEHFGLADDALELIKPQIQNDVFDTNGIVVFSGDTSYSFYSSVAKPKQIKKEGLSEYFLYTIEGTETIPDKWGKRLISFEANSVDVNSLYKYDQDRWADQTIRFVSIANDKDHNLGTTPLPNGNIKIYADTGDDGYLSYVGGTDVKYIPVDEKVELNLGSARLVSVEPVLMDTSTGDYTFDTEGNVTGWVETSLWQVKLTNARKIPVELKITRGFDTQYWQLEMIDDGGKVIYEKHDADHARFNTKLGPINKRVFGYKLKTYRGLAEKYWKGN